MDNSYYWIKLGEASIEDLFNIHPLQNKEYIFYNNNKNIDSSYLKSIGKTEKYSLCLVSPQNVYVHIKHWTERVQITMSFDYNGNRYSYLSITDPEFEQKYAQYLDGSYNYREDCLLVISLGDIYPTNGKHYKLIAKVINI